VESGRERIPLMSEQAEYTYDVFISYSHADKAWVWGELLPRLDGAGLRVCIDDRDFEIGVSSLVNMERAVDNSRHTLIVLTPAWVESQWAEFESLLASTTDPAGRQRKLIPLMLESCRLPPRIRILTYADLTQSHDHVDQFNRLLAQLQGTETTLDQLYTEVKQAEAKQDWQRMITVCQEIIGIAPFYRDVQRLLRKARFHSAMQCAESIWARYKTSIVILPVLLLMAAGIPILGKRIVSVWQLTPMLPTPQVSVEAFLITKGENPTVTVKPGTTITATVEEIVQVQAEVSATYEEQEEDLLFTWYTCSEGGKSVVRKIGNPEMLYVAPSEPGADCICVVIEKGGVLLDRSEIFVNVQE
jgi:hypothetical protein